MSLPLDHPVQPPSLTIGPASSVGGVCTPSLFRSYAPETTLVYPLASGFSLHSNEKNKGKAGVTGCNFIQENEKVREDGSVNNVLAL